MKLLNLTHDALHSIFPFVLSKINRVSFGLLSEEEIDKALKEDPMMPRSRTKTAVPFVGKDVPSHRSEFAHPDIVICLTILAFRYEGLRQMDFLNMLKDLQERMWNEEGPYHKRNASILFSEWVRLAGGRVKGSLRDDKQRKNDQKLASNRQISDGSVSGKKEIWALHLINIDDTDQFNVVYQLLHKVPNVVHHYLSTVIFPDVMRHQGIKISACGQELGSEMLFPRRLGFSGTPSDLLPLELGKCQYELGSDGKMISYLTSPAIVNYTLLDAWTPQSILDMIATAGNEFIVKVLHVY
jgi:hypothetical protein